MTKKVRVSPAVLRPRYSLLTAALVVMATTALAGRNCVAQAANAQTHSLGGITFGNSDHSAHTPVERSVRGIVYDKDGKVAKGARVFLKNTHDASIVSVVTDEQGAYQFSPLASGVDYEIWAGKQENKHKPISSFNDGPMVMTLAVE